MELVFLGNISNIDNLNNGQLTSGNGNSLDKFNTGLQIFSELGDSTCMLSNIEEMENELKKLTDYGYLAVDSTSYEVMKQLATDARNLLLKCQGSANVSLDVICDFYTIRKNHSDIANSLKSSSPDGSV